MPNYQKLTSLNELAIGLNIEGYRPTLTLPDKCKWYNIIQVIDEPLKGINFDTIMKIVKDNKYDYIEQAINLNMDIFIKQLTAMINKIKKSHKNVLVHVHQYTGTTILDKTLENQTNVKTILDTTNFFETPINYCDKYPDIDALISISQCAGFGLDAGKWIIPTSFMEFDVKNNIIYTEKIFATNNINNIKPYIDFDYVEGNILMVNDLWNPDLSLQNDVLLLPKKI